MNKILHISFTLLLGLFISKPLFSQNNAMRFSSAFNNHITIPNTSVYPTNNFTIEFWMNVRVIPVERKAIINNAECITDNASWVFTLHEDMHISFAFNCTGDCQNTISYNCNQVLIPGECYHVAVTYSSAGIKMYINGLPENGYFSPGSGYCGNLHHSSEPIRIGAYRNVSNTIGNYFEGMIDEVRLWSTVKSPSEILDQYNAELNGNEPFLLLYTKFNDSIAGPGQVILNSASLTGSTLNGTTLSTNATSPFTSGSCFSYVNISNETYHGSSIYIFYNQNDETICVIPQHTNDNPMVTQIEILTILGEPVLLANNTRLPVILNVSTFSKGTYIIRAQSISKTYTYKFLRF